MTKTNNLYVVGIGASAGGLDAIQKLFDNLPADIGMAFIIVQHLSPNFKSLMPELLSKHTDLRIFTAEDGQSIQPNCIYLNPHDKDLIIKEKKLRLIKKERKIGINLPIDLFFHSLGEEFKEYAIGIVLSGTGSDSSRGIKTIKEAGGTIIVQEPLSAQFNGMPNAAISTNLAEYIANPGYMHQILAKIRGQRLLSVEPSGIAKSDETVFSQILEEVYKTSGIDFKKYKKNTLLRRIEKRMNYHNLDTLKDYLKFFKLNKKEVEILKKDFLIQVTSFFRDPEAFESLKEKVIPALVKSKKKNETIRVWVAGCSTGEEAFSIAICLDDYIQSHSPSTNYKIFASDVDHHALGNIGQSSFSVNAVSEIDPYYLERYFVKTGDRIEVIKRMRDKIVFSPHNLMKDPPFIHMDLISCRNVLIYFDNKIQKNVLKNFQYALNKNGYLFLGNSESLGDLKKDFTPIDSKWKIFQNISDSKYLPFYNSQDKIQTFNFPPIERVHRKELKPAHSERPESHFHRILSQKYSPDCILYDREFNVLYIKGEAGQKLILQEGVFQNNLLSMVNKEMSHLIRTITLKLDKTDKDIHVENIPDKKGDEYYKASLCFSKLNNHSDWGPVYSITFEQEEKQEFEIITLQNQPSDEFSNQRIEELENELKLSRFDLQNVVEELETSNEELQSSNEELMASNEELQSTNEELQSVNEELHTVNSELQEKNKELEDLNNDITNLLNSTDIGTLFLDSDLRIRKFTPALQRLFNLKEEDISRPISNFAANFNEEIRLSIISDSKKALKELITIEKEIQDDRGNYFLKRISPFITSSKKIEGVIITFVDISSLKEQEKLKSESEQRYKKLFDAMNESFVHGTIITNGENQAVDWKFNNLNNAFISKSKFKSNDITNQLGSDLVKDQIEFKSWLKRFAHTALTGDEQTFSDYLSFMKGYHSVHIFSPAEGEFAVIFIDLTRIKKTEESLRRANQRFELASDITGLALWEWNVQEDTAKGNRYWKKLFGFTDNKVTAQWHQNMVPEDIEKTSKSLKLHLEEKRSKYQQEFRYIHPKTKKEYWISSIGKVIKKDESGNPLKVLGISLDITKQKEDYERLVKEKLFSQRLSEANPNGIYIFNTITKKFEYLNKHYTQLFGYTIDELNKLFENNYRAIQHPDDHQLIDSKIEEMISKRTMVSMEYRLKHKKGHWLWCLAYLSPFQTNEQNKITTYIGVLLDLTDRKKMEEEIIREKKKAETANLHKNLFLANISHEIRTPMNHVIGFSQLLKKENLTKKDKEKFLSIINSSSNQLINLIDDIINTAKIEAGEVKIIPRECDIESMFLNIKTTYDQYLLTTKKSKLLTLQLSLSPDENSPVIIIDELRVKQIINNLLNNAIKFTEKGNITLGYQLGKDDPILTFFVSDQGIGISKDKLDELFESFKQVSHDPKRYGGTGLGLAICKGLVSLMNGTIHVESELNKGTTFTISIPYKKALKKITRKAQPRKLKPSDDFLKGKKILIAEDDEFIQLHLNEILKDTGAELIFASNGKKVLQEFLTHGDINLILMDVRMPEMNGYDATKEILKMKEDAIIIMQSAYAMQDEKEKCYQLGCKDYLTKPIDRDTLLATLQKWLS